MHDGARVKSILFIVRHGKTNLTSFGDIEGDLFLSRNSVKSSFGVGKLLAKVGPMPVKRSFIIFGIRDFMLTVVLLFGCLRQLLFIDVFFL